MIDIFFIYRAEEVESKPQDCNGEDKSFLMMSKLEWQDGELYVKIDTRTYVNEIYQKLNHV